MPGPNEEMPPEVVEYFDKVGSPPLLKIDPKGVPMIRDMSNVHFPHGESMRAIAPGFDAEGNRVYRTAKEETTPAGLIVARTTDQVVNGVIVDSQIDVIEAEPVPMTDTQRLRRMLDEFDVFSDDVHGNAEAMHQIRLLAARIERNHAVHVLQYVLQTVFNDEIRATRKLAGQVGSKSEVRYALLAALGKGITDLIEANQKSK